MSPSQGASKATETDILIVGAGPAGLLCAVCAAAYGLNARVIEKRPEKMRGGHADGLHPRSMEILHTFGLADEIIKQGQPLVQTCTYQKDEDGNLKRVKMSKEPWKAPSPFNAWALGQSKISRILERYAADEGGIHVERGCTGMNLVVKPEEDHPVHVTVQKDEENASEESIETIKAKYVVGCDGARSWVRSQLGIEMVGNDTNVVWGVMDIVPITNLPTSRSPSLIFSNGGDIMWLPREDGLVRIYCKLSLETRTQDSTVTAEKIMDNLRHYLHPYTIEYEYCDWHSSYQIGQKLATHNIDPNSGRVFLAGDSVHIHSPHAGQGMNVSMHDAFNLMWKLNLVLKGFADPSLLQTYSEERLVEGERLLEFDRTMAAIASGEAPPPSAYIPAAATSSDGTVEAEKIEWSLRIQGLQVFYPPSKITASNAQDSKAARDLVELGQLPHGIVTGMRMPSYHVRRQADGWLQRLGDAFKSNGSFYLVIFAGDLSQVKEKERLLELGCQLEELAHKYPFMEVLTVHSADPQNVNQMELPNICNRAFLSRVFCDWDMCTWEGIQLGSSYEKYDVDPARGTKVVLIRPDMYVALQAEFEDGFGAIQAYFQELSMG